LCFRPTTELPIVVSIVSLICLAALGAIAGRAGGASAVTGAMRVAFWGRTCDGDDGGRRTVIWNCGGMSRARRFF